jgi:predicted dehydrogenase
MQIGLGVIGGGNFGLYALQQFLQVDGVRLVALAATHREAARAFGRRFGIDTVLELDQLLDHPQIDMVYIATPPFLHYEQALAALQAGKHVFCEKPLALKIAEADQLAWVRDRRHQRRLTEQESRDALAMACEADRLACQSARG